VDIEISKNFQCQLILIRDRIRFPNKEKDETHNLNGRIRREDFPRPW
jgi:hypothetical protein